MPPDDRGGSDVELRTEFERDPLNAPIDAPRFSWRVDATSRGARQTAYRVLVARSPDAIREGRGDVWDSGRVESDRSTGVGYDGPPLYPGATYYWTVHLWSEDGDRSVAEPAAFSTAVEHSDWTGEWIGYQPGPGDSNGYRSRWGEDVADEWVQVDLGEPREIAGIDLYPAAPFDGPETPDGATIPASPATGDGSDDRGVPGFGFPRQYRVEVADDPAFESARTVVDRADATRGAPTEGPATFDVDARGRYVRVTPTQGYTFDPAEDSRVKADVLPEERRAWSVFALGALAVRDAEGTDLAAGRPVSAASSHEVETWGREHLVDGVYGSETAATSPRLRTEVDLEKPVERARVHVCGLGYGELHVNGDRIGDAVLDPGWTDYAERALYRTHDVSDALAEGENALGLWLGRGWFSKSRELWTGFGSPRARLHLTVEYADGTTRTVGTTPDWRADTSPIVENDIYDGEVYDAREEQPGWAEPGFDDADWDDATRMAAPGGDLVPQRTPPIRETRTFEPESIDREAEAPIVDFGQNLVGWIELTVRDAEAGDRIRIAHAETLLEDGSLDRVDLRSADAADTYVAAGDDAETYRPRFTYHGFRYARIEGYPGDLDPADIEARAVHTDLDPAGDFDCSDDDLAQVQHNAEWGLRGNLHGVLTDCPQRDERFGWTGDNHVASRALMYNFDAARFYEKWTADHDDDQTPGGCLGSTIPFGYGSRPSDPTWTITRVTIPWQLYRHYGDAGVLRRSYEPMRRYVDFWHAASEDGLIGEEHGDYGDWLAFENADGPRGLPHDFFNTAFHYHVTSLFARIAGVLGNDADRERYAARAAETRRAFNDAFFDAETATYEPETQSSFAVPLFVGLVPEEHEAAVADGLAAAVRDAGGKLRTGFLGTRPLVHVLADHGHEELAYRVVSQPERPGWVYMVHSGATTMWERWDSDDRIGDGMNSFNHSPFTFVSEWFYRVLLGIDFDPTIADGIEIAPAVVADLDWAAGHVDTVKGEIAVRWEREAGRVELDVTVPWNTGATVRLPAGSDRTPTVEDRPIDPAASTLPDGVRSVDPGDDETVVEVGAGEYVFAWQAGG